MVDEYDEGDVVERRDKVLTLEKREKTYMASEYMLGRPGFVDSNFG